MKWSMVAPGVTWEEMGGNSRRKALGGNTSRQTASRSPLNAFVCCNLSAALLVGVHVVQVHENGVVAALLIGSYPK